MRQLVIILLLCAMSTQVSAQAVPRCDGACALRLFALDSGARVQSGSGTVVPQDSDRDVVRLGYALGPVELGVRYNGVADDPLAGGDAAAVTAQVGRLGYAITMGDLQNDLALGVSSIVDLTDRTRVVAGYVPGDEADQNAYMVGASIQFGGRAAVAGQLSVDRNGTNSADLGIRFDF